jgi:enhancer of mRNA-decapping protein 3
MTNASQSNINNPKSYQSISVAALFQSAAATKTTATTKLLNNNNTKNISNQQQQQQQQHKQQLVDNSNNNNGNYRYDEMVIKPSGEPVNPCQIKLLNNTNSNTKNESLKTYVTDDGFIIPCITYETRQKLFEQAIVNGLSRDRQIESMGRACAEMAIQLVGGQIRFLPKNNHQKPSILILCNKSLPQGAYALCAARLLLLRNCKIYILIQNANDKNLEVENELNLINSCFITSSSSSSSDSNGLNSNSDCIIMQNVNELFNNNNNRNEASSSFLYSLDLIINGIESSFMSYNTIMSTQEWFKQLSKLIEHESCRASLLTIDPCNEKSLLKKTKWSLFPVLPLQPPIQSTLSTQSSQSSSTQRVYLCDLGFTPRMFQNVQIKYKSPFGAKFCIPLHEN